MSKGFRNKLIKQSDVNIMELENEKDSNKRRFKQFIVTSTCQTCQLQMGITELQSGSVWNRFGWKKAGQFYSEGSWKEYIREQIMKLENSLSVSID